MFPASYGDSFLVTCVGNENTYVLIDMGFMSTYSNSIKDKLVEINNNNESLALLVLTHVDDDHISGAIRFFAENGNSKKPSIIKVNNIWYNSYRHLQFDKRKASFSHDAAYELVNIEKNKEILERMKKNRPRERGAVEKLNISTLQGSTIASLLFFYDYMDCWNSHFNHEAVITEEMQDNDGILQLRQIKLSEDVNVTILSPNLSKLRLLHDLWREKLISEGYEGVIINDEWMDDAYEVFMANMKEEKTKTRKLYKIATENNITGLMNEEFEADSAPVNGSSIAFILEFKKKRILFLADAHTDILIESLKKLAKKEGNTRIYFDAVKISHHGSKHNTSKELLEIIDTERYIFSTNGRGKGFIHPDIETIFRIITTNTERKKTLIFNYKPLHIIKMINNEELKTKYNYDIEYSNDLSGRKLNDITTVEI